MFKTLYLKLYLYFRSPKMGSVYFGNPKRFIIGKPIEYVLHGLKDKDGDTMFEPIPGDHCYKISIDKTEENTYSISTEVFCKLTSKYNLNTGNSDFGKWMKRCQNRKIGKEYLLSLILDGTLDIGNNCGCLKGHKREK